MDYSDTTINFLGVSVTKNSTKSPADLFTKGTDSHQYLHVTSCHPYRCKNLSFMDKQFALKEKPNLANPQTSMLQVVLLNPMLTCF